MNFIESLIAEWLAYNGYFVRRNVKVGRRPEGGWEGELVSGVSAYETDLTD